MEALIKAVRSPSHRPFSLSSKHKKLPDRWGDYQHRDKIWDGVTFYVKYLGNTLVSELDEEGQSYGDSISAEAVKTIVAMAKASGKKLPKMSILVSPNGIRVTNADTLEVFTDLDIYRICFCTADRDHPKVFAYIARNRENETMECQAFLCSKRKSAEAVTLTVAESFKLAQEKWEEEEKRMKEKQLIAPPTLSESSPNAGQPAASLATPSLGFDDNFADLPVLSATYSRNANNRSQINPFKMSNFSATVHRDGVGEGVVSTSQGYLTSPEYEASSHRGPTCYSPSSADELLCL